MHVSIFAGAIAVVASSASAQLVTSITQPIFGLNPPEVFFTDVSSGANSFLFDPSGIPSTAGGFGGLAADEVGRRLFGSVRNGPQDDLYALDYATLTPTRIGQINVGGAGLSVDGLAYDTAGSRLFATRGLGTGGNAEGLFLVDQNTGSASLLLEYDAGGSSDFTFNAIDYDPLTGLVYLVDEDTTGGTGIWSYDPNSGVGGALSFVADLAPGVTDVDGLGAGDGRLYLVSDSNPDGNGGQHAVFDLLSNQYVDFLDSPHPPYTTGTPFGTINVSAAGAFAPGIPTPGVAGVLALGGVLAARRRR